jgi:hypothetical protein
MKQDDDNRTNSMEIIIEHMLYVFIVEFDFNMNIAYDMQYLFFHGDSLI